MILGAAGGPDAYHLHGCSTAVVVRGQVYLVDFGKQVKLYGPPSAATNAPAGTNGLEPNPITLSPANPTPGFKDVMRAFVEGPYAYDNNLRIRDEGMPDLLGLAGGTPQLLLTELPAPGGATGRT